MVILAVRIAGRVDNKAKEVETMKRLKLDRKFSAVLIDEKDVVKMGMVRAVSKSIAYGKVDDAFVKKLEAERKPKDGTYSLHPPRGGFKKSSRLPTPKGILGEHEDITKLAGRML
jgi:ribosomal protein L30/L7E